MAGANIGALNALLEPYHIAFGDKRVLSGDFLIDQRQVIIDSGTEIVKFPKDSYLISADLKEERMSAEASKANQLRNKDDQLNEDHALSLIQNLTENSNS